MTERVCSVKGCVTKLASFNSGKTCYVHTQPQFFAKPRAGNGKGPRLPDLTKEEKAAFHSGEWLG